jgi:predicted nucleic acid-binding protein
VADYFDTSALAKLVLVEDETEALRAWIAERGDVPAVTCDLTRTELLRAVRRIDPGLLARAREVLDGLTIVELPTALFTMAGRLEPSTMRSLDAIHLAAALDLGDDLDVLLAYDERLVAAARSHGIEVVHPGLAAF